MDWWIESKVVVEKEATRRNITTIDQSPAKKIPTEAEQEKQLERNLEEEVDMMTSELGSLRKKRFEDMTPQQFRRKSDLPVEYAVLAEMIAHKSIER
jgi:hypothetical protein